jgi:hypothetical protein
VRVKNKSFLKMTALFVTAVSAAAVCRSARADNCETPELKTFANQVAMAQKVNENSLRINHYLHKELLLARNNSFVDSAGLHVAIPFGTYRLAAGATALLLVPVAEAVVPESIAVMTGRWIPRLVGSLVSIVASPSVAESPAPSTKAQSIEGKLAELATRVAKEERDDAITWNKTATQLASEAKNTLLQFLNVSNDINYISHLNIVEVDKKGRWYNLGSDIVVGLQLQLDNIRTQIKLDELRRDYLKKKMEQFNSRCEGQLP